MIHLNRPAETVSESIDSPIQAQRISTIRQIAGVLGNTIEVGSDIVAETGKLTVYTGGRIIRGIGETYGALRDGLSGKSYPTGK